MEHGTATCLGKIAPLDSLEFADWYCKNKSQQRKYIVMVNNCMLW